MTPERAQLIQDLAKIEIAEMILERAETNNEPNFARRHSLKYDHDRRQHAWCDRVNAAQFTAEENTEFQRVRSAMMQLAAPALNLRRENAR